MNSDHWQVIEDALTGQRKYINATHLTFDAERVEKVKSIDAALAFVREQRAQVALLAPDEVREALAEYAHEAWSGWMKYLFQKGKHQEDGTFSMPQWAVERWQRQMNTPYAELPEEEKKSDREEADKMLAIVEQRPQPKEGAAQPQE
jgi:hypothetical protein